MVDPDIVKLKSKALQFVARNYDLLESALPFAPVPHIGSIRSVEETFLLTE